MTQTEFIAAYEHCMQNTKGVHELLNMITDDKYLIFIRDFEYFTRKVNGATEIYFNRNDFNENSLAHEILHGIYLFNDFKPPNEIWDLYIKKNSLMKVFSNNDVQQFVNSLSHLHFKPLYLKNSFVEDEFVENQNFKVEDSVIKELLHSYSEYDPQEIIKFISVFINLKSTHNDQRSDEYEIFLKELTKTDPELFNLLIGFIKLWSGEEIKNLEAVLAQFFTDLEALINDKGVKS